MNARRVLDVGCGDGFLATTLAERVPEAAPVDPDGVVLQYLGPLAEPSGVLAVVTFVRPRRLDVSWQAVALE